MELRCHEIQKALLEIHTAIMDLKGKKIILASGSPRRRELLGAMGIEFTVDTGNTFEEVYSPDTPHDQIPVLMAEGKSHGFHRELTSDEILITSDTMVLCDGQVMGKPKDREDAIRMISFLCGKAHEVITAVTIRDCKKSVTFSDKTIVRFRNLSLPEIEYYVDNYKPFDKAGAYAIQEWIGHVGISGVEGSMNTVIGFPTHRVYEELLKFI